MAEAFLRDSILDLKDLHDTEEDDLKKKKRLEKSKKKDKKLKKKKSLMDRVKEADSDPEAKIFEDTRKTKISFG